MQDRSQFKDDQTFIVVKEDGKEDRVIKPENEEDSSKEETSK